MNSFAEIKNALNEKKLDSAFSAVYAKDEYNTVYSRFESVLDDFKAYFGDGEERELSLFSAPGRTEIGGNHTDHNNGRVLAASVNLDAIAVASKNESGFVCIKSKGYDMDKVSLSELSASESEYGKSSALIRGILSRFTQLGYNIGSFDATTASNVLSGSGLSSSAAFEILVCTILNHLFNDGKISPVELAKISQYAENVYFGKPSGLLDQTACSVGGFVMIDFEDNEKPVIEKIDFDFEKTNHALCIVDTKGNHSDLTDEYAAVRGEMNSVAEYFGKKVLRRVDEKEFFEKVNEVRNATSERAVLRAIHFFGDNSRVLDQAAALKAGDFEKFKSCVIDSGLSSYMYNQNVYSNKAPTNQPLSLALALCEKMLKGVGAWRVHGGGFAGTIQAYVPNERLDEFKSTMNSVFGNDACYVLSVRPYGGVRFI